MSISNNFFIIIVIELLYKVKKKSDIKMTVKTSFACQYQHLLLIHIKVVNGLEMLSYFYIISDFFFLFLLTIFVLTSLALFIFFQ
jgi:hypothetical protein